MDESPHLPQIEHALLTDVVRRALSQDTVEVQEWECIPVSGGTGSATGGVYRISGKARNLQEERPWSVVLKVLQGPDESNDSDPAGHEYWKREFLAYQSGILTQLNTGLVAPRCFGLQEYPGNRAWLWLEDLGNEAQQRWSLEEFRRAARDLGRFNGSNLASETWKDLPWLTHHWLRNWVESHAGIVPFVQDANYWETPEMRPHLPHSEVERLLRLWEDRHTLLNALEALPQTLCHLDAFRCNLFLQTQPDGTERTLAIDWAFAGSGALGEEIAELVAASLLWSEFPSADAALLGDAVLESYLAGLNDVGWQGNSDQVRYGYATAAALRWAFRPLWWLHGTLQSAANRPPEDTAQIVAKFVAIRTYLLQLADEARTLLPTL